MVSIVYVKTFCDKPIPDVFNHIAHLINGVDGVCISKYIHLHADDRTCPADYGSKIVFIQYPNTGHVYKLDELAMFVDDRYTTLYFLSPYYAIVLFKYDLSDSLWHLIRPLMPSPDLVCNAKVANLAYTAKSRQVRYIDTSLKGAVFDQQDILLDMQ